MGSTSRGRPSAASGLAIAGGILVIIGGVAVSALGALLTFFIGGLGGIFGLLGIMWGVLMIVCAVLLRSNPDQHVGLGVAIILFSIFSWIGAFGGFAIGFLLGLIGGIMAIVWSPEVISVTYVSQTTVPPPAYTTSPGVFCTNCGKPIIPGNNFCGACGKVV